MEVNTSTMVVLNGRNYPLWKGRMRDLLYVNSLHEPVFSAEKPADKTDEEWTLLHRQVCGCIRLWVDDSVLIHIMGETHAGTLWRKLQELYAPKTTINKHLLMKQLRNMRYQDGSLIIHYLGDFQGVLNQLLDMDLKIPEELQAMILLQSLPESWETFKMLLIDTAPEGNLTMKYVQSSLLTEDMRRKSQGTSSQLEVLATEKRGRNKSGRPKPRNK